MRFAIARALLGAVTVAAFAYPTRAWAQKSSEDAQRDCGAAFRQIQGTPSTAQDKCRALGNIVSADLADAQELFIKRRAADTALAITPRKLQSTRSGEAVPAGVPGQADAVPTVQPTSLAAANIAAAGTDSGTKAIVALSINPITIFGNGDSAAVARWSRFADLTVLVPLTNGALLSESKLEYFGLRARVNITGLNEGDGLLRDVTAAFDEARKIENDLAVQAAAAFRLLPDSTAIVACAKAIREAMWGDRPEACRGEVVVGLGDAARKRLQESLARAREKADARYFGLDLRFDTGDPTLGGDSTKDVTSLQAGLAFGRRYLGQRTQGTALAIQGRLGGRYLKPKVKPDSVTWAFEGALGFEASRLITIDQAVRFTSGLEFRYSNKPNSVAKRLQTDYLALRGSVTVPIVSGTSVSVGFVAPMVGDLSPSLSVNFNWGLLLASLGR